MKMDSRSQTTSKERKSLDYSSQNDKLNILQIGALGLPVRRDLIYAGTERVISYLDSHFTKLGHNSILAGPGDSDIDGELYSTIPRSLWANKNDAGSRNILSGDKAYVLHYNRVIDFLKQRNIDVAHDHPGNGFVHSDEYLKRGNQIKETPILTTQHGKYLPEYSEKYRLWAKLLQEGFPIYFNSISNSQKQEFEEKTGIDIREVIYHGIPLELFPFNPNPQEYLFSLGRICDDKGQHIAVETAKKTGRPLYIAGEVHSVDQDYFNRKVKPFLDFSIFDVPRDMRSDYKEDLLKAIESREETIKDGQVHFIGGLNDKEKSVLFKNSFAFLMPIRWPEPFGLVMIESMATGTPVVSFDYGSVSEVLEDGKTGFVIDKSSILGKNSKPNLELMADEMSGSVDKIGSLSRRACRERVKKNFTIEKEAANYLRLYRELIS